MCQKIRGCVPGKCAKKNKPQKQKCARKQCVPKSKVCQKAMCAKKQSVPKRGCTPCTMRITPNRQSLTTPLRPWCVHNKKSCLNRPPPARCNATYARPTTTFWPNFGPHNHSFGRTSPRHQHTTPPPNPMPFSRFSLPRWILHQASNDRPFPRLRLCILSAPYPHTTPHLLKMPLVSSFLFRIVTPFSYSAFAFVFIRRFRIQFFVAYSAAHMNLNGPNLSLQKHDMGPHWPRGPIWGPHGPMGHMGP